MGEKASGRYRKNPYLQFFVAIRHRMEAEVFKEFEKAIVNRAENHSNRKSKKRRDDTDSLLEIRGTCPLPKKVQRNRQMFRHGDSRYKCGREA